MWGDKEIRDLNHCLQIITDYVWELEKLRTMSLIAFEADDWDWQHSICEELDKRKEEILG